VFGVVIIAHPSPALTMRPFVIRMNALPSAIVSVAKVEMDRLWLVCETFEDDVFGDVRNVASSSGHLGLFRLGEHGEVRVVGWVRVRAGMMTTREA
jgi:hypothetical protein